MSFELKGLFTRIEFQPVTDIRTDIILYQRVFYRPQRIYGKVMFLLVSVRPREWGGVWQTPPHPDQADSPLEQTPPQQTATAAGGTHPTGINSCLDT